MGKKGVGEGVIGVKEGGVGGFRGEIGGVLVDLGGEDEVSGGVYGGGYGVGGEFFKWGKMVLRGRGIMGGVGGDGRGLMGI